MDRIGFEELKELGAGRLAPEAIVALDHEAFAKFGTQALWSRRPSAHPTITQALVVAESLRPEGTCARARWPPESKTPAVPLSSLQSHVLLALAAHRNRVFSTGRRRRCVTRA